jgi:hypothetical protein
MKILWLIYSNSGGIFSETLVFGHILRELGRSKVKRWKVLKGIVYVKQKKT